MTVLKEYKLPNGCTLRPGGKIRIPRDQVAKIPVKDWLDYNLELVLGDESHGSVVVTMRPDTPTGDSGP